MAEATKSRNPSVRKPLTVERLREVLDYNPITGVFTCKIDRSGGVKAGDVAGSRHHGEYLAMHVDGRRYYAHRLAWFYVHGEWPEKGIDHKHLDPSHNGIENLRPADQSDNMANIRAHKDSASGHKGVYWYKAYNKWTASITRKSKSYFLGYFEYKSDAISAYAKAAKELFGEFART